MILFAAKFPFATKVNELMDWKEKLWGLDCCEVWRSSWLLIIAGTVYQLFAYF